MPFQNRLKRHHYTKGDDPPVPRISRNVLPSKPETAVKPIMKLLLLTVLMVLGNSVLLAAERGTLVREAVIYVSPDTASSKLGQAERGRELILLDKSHNWLHVEALLGLAQTPDPAFVLDDEDQGKTISGWVLDSGVVWASTPNGDRILFGAAVDSEDEASRRHGRRGAAQDALRLYHRVYDMFPSAPLAGEALYRAADIQWQIDKSDMQSRPSAREKESYLRVGIDDRFDEAGDEEVSRHKVGPTRRFSPARQQTLRRLAGLFQVPRQGSRHLRKVRKRTPRISRRSRGAVQRRFSPSRPD